MKGLRVCKQPGNVGNLLITGICILAMAAVMVTYMDYVSLLQEKEAVGQLARKYILRMESIGYLAVGDRTRLTMELREMGVTEIEYNGTTLTPVGYGEEIVLEIGGKLKGEYDFAEKRISTAKN